MTYSVRNIVIAVVLAVLAAVLVIMYTSNAQKQATKGQDECHRPGRQDRHRCRHPRVGCDLERAASLKTR